MKILVTGATGQFGSKVVETLLSFLPSENIAVSVRDPEKANSFKARGVEVRQGDFDNAASLDLAFNGINRILIVSTQGDNETRIHQHLTAVSAAKRAGVNFIAYTSVVNADENPLDLAPVHHATEEAIRKTGIPFSFLRNNWYIENEMGAIQGVLAGAPLVTSAGKGKVGWATRHDYAEAAAMVLGNNGHENTIYELSGNPMSYDDLALILGKILDRKVPVQHVDDATYADIMKRSGVPQEIVPFLVSINNAIRQNALDIQSDDLSKLLNRPLISIEETIRRLIK